MMARIHSAAAAVLACAILLTAFAFQTPGSVRAAQGARTGEAFTYPSPVEMLLSPGGSRMYVLCQGSDEVRVLRTSSKALLTKIPVGHIPRGFVLGPAGARLYVANTWDDTVSVIDTATLKVTATWSVGLEPTGVALDRSGRHLFVANRISNDVAVLDTSTGTEEKRLAAGRGASYIASSPDGSRLYVTHIYPNSPREATEGGNRTLPRSEITVIDAERATVVQRISLPGVAHSFHIAFSRDGHLGVLAQLHPHNLVPLAHLEHSGAFTDTLTLFGTDVGKPVEVPLDELEYYASRPFGVAISADKTRLYVGSSGAEVVTVIDLTKLLAFVKSHTGPLAQDLSASAHYVMARIPVGHDPRGMIFEQGGARLLVANRLDDSITAIDTHSNHVAATVSMGPRTINVLRHGEQTFYTSRYSFQGQIGCANCHLDSTFDGLTWDLEPDGFGRDIVDNRPIEALRGTEPYKWNGGNPNLPTECGPRTEKFFWRSENYDNLTLTDLVIYIRSIPARPNRWQEPNGQLTMAQERGKAVFDRGVDKFGKPIAELNRCATCHSGPKGTSQKSFDVGTRKSTDNSGTLDTPQLTNIALSPPYLHDGSARTLEEIWTVFNPDDKHGRTNDLTKDELNDLIEYLRTR